MTSKGSSILLLKLNSSIFPSIKEFYRHLNHHAIYIVLRQLSSLIIMTHDRQCMIDTTPVLYHSAYTKLLSYNALNVSGVWYNVKCGVRRQLVIILLHLFTNDFTRKKGIKYYYFKSNFRPVDIFQIISCEHAIVEINSAHNNYYIRLDVVPIRPMSAEPLEYSLFDFVLPGTSLLAQGAQNPCHDMVKFFFGVGFCLALIGRPFYHCLELSNFGHFEWPTHYLLYQ
ncbi:hypothetical protein AGLY_000617 [Aphis glycines]|uniref:Uncharacterized protein n=1 Tax=Aphis glycines TaxID=307491 RepID=A0A6G0U7M3_APHGL|nr:hypothetical protein AGLY_000617 [Aphis glycines]